MDEIKILEEKLKAAEWDLGFYTEKKIQSEIMVRVIEEEIERLKTKTNDSQT